MPTQAPKNSELCPECGEFFPKLVARTGWCRSCTNQIDRNSPICLTCGNAKPIDEACPYCRLERWLERNADHIEHYMELGNSFTKSVDLVRADVMPRCASCGGLIKHAGRNVVFCRKNDRCRKAVRRYAYLTQGLGINGPQALSQVLQEINGD